MAMRALTSLIEALRLVLLELPCERGRVTLEDGLAAFE